MAFRTTSSAVVPVDPREGCCTSLSTAHGEGDSNDDRAGENLTCRQSVVSRGGAGFSSASDGTAVSFRRSPVTVTDTGIPGGARCEASSPL